MNYIISSFGDFSLLACALTTEDGSMESREERREILYRGKDTVYESGIVEHNAYIPASEQEKENRFHLRFVFLIFFTSAVIIYLYLLIIMNVYNEKSVNMNPICSFLI